jgi:hypothetical protein
MMSTRGRVSTRTLELWCRTAVQLLALEDLETRLVLCDLFGLVVLLLGRHGGSSKVEQSTSAVRSKGGGEKLKVSSYEIRAAVYVLL